MRDLKTALFCEGVTDSRFLPPLILRTLDDLLRRYGRYAVEPQQVAVVNDVLDKSGLRGEEAILLTARRAYDFDLLFVHADADAPTPDDARAHRFQPGYDSVQSLPKSELVCRRLIPIIPVYEIEAWMLADWRTLFDFLNFDISPSALEKLRREFKLPKDSKGVERHSDPKSILDNIIGRSKASLRLARRQSDMGAFQSRLGESVDLMALRKVPAFREFERLLQENLAALGMIE